MISKILPKAYRVYLSLGTEIAISLAAPILLGYALDSYLTSKPLGLLSGVMLGIILFFFRMFALVKRLGTGENESEG